MWAFNKITDKTTPPDAAPGQILLCLRGKTAIAPDGDGGQVMVPEKRFPLVIDLWGPLGWESGRIGGGEYQGYYEIPSWQDWHTFAPDTDGPVLLFNSRFLESWQPLPRGFYVGRCDTENGHRQWRIMPSYLDGVLPPGKEWLRVPAAGFWWIELPS